MRASPDPVAEFAEQVSLRFDRIRPESFFECEWAFRRLLDSACLREQLCGMLRSVRGNPYAQGEWTLGQVLLRQGPAWALSIGLYERSTRFLHTSPHLALYAPLGGQALSVDRYRLPASYNNAVFDPGLKLEASGSLVVPCGELLAVRPEPEIVDFRIDAPQLLLKFTSSAWHVLEWLFDRTSLKAIQANDAALTTTQLRVAAYLLGRLAHPSSIGPLKQLADHNVPNVRWAAIQNLGRLSPVDARARLETARQDRHPHIRRAAEKSLALNSAKKTVE